GHAGSSPGPCRTPPEPGAARRGCRGCWPGGGVPADTWPWGRATRACSGHVGGSPGPCRTPPEPCAARRGCSGCWPARGVPALTLAIAVERLMHCQGPLEVVQGLAVLPLSLEQHAEVVNASGQVGVPLRILVLGLEPLLQCQGTLEVVQGLAVLPLSLEQL